MRIRKHAAKFLSSLSIPNRSLAGAAEAAWGRELEMHVCELNQSPWDAMSFTPPGSVSSFPYQELEQVEVDNDFVGSVYTEEQEAVASPVSDVSRVAAAEFAMRRRVKAEVMSEENVDGRKCHRRERRNEYVTKKKNTGCSNGNIVSKKTNRRNTSGYEAPGVVEDQRVKMELDTTSSAAVATPLSTCKKNDGKGWHCRRPAQHPNSLCAYHLNQVRSYYANGVGTGHSAVHHQQQRKILPKAQDSSLVPHNNSNNKKKTTTITAKKGSSGHCHKSSAGSGGRSRRQQESDFYYYYTGLGPWRGKRRSGGGADRDRSSNVSASQGDNEQHDAAPSPMVHDQAPDDLDDDDDDDVDGGDDAGRHDGDDDVAAGRRRTRKPIKARSLKSLL